MEILVSGAGIAGCTLAWWLGRQGHRVTVVERAGAQRSSGAPIDVIGPALQVVEQMGIASRLRAAATGVDGMAFAVAPGRVAVRVDVAALQRASDRRDIELPRGDLAALLQEAATPHAEFLFGDQVVGLTQDAGGVDVTFERGRARRFDLVVGADGLHSGVRRLAFGGEERFVQHMGLYVATVQLPRPEAGRDVVMFNAPGRSLTIHPSRGKAMAAFIFWSPQLPIDHRDVEQQRRTLEQVYATDGWRVPELLEVARATHDLYFDAVSRVQLPAWSNGRVVLLGDAAACVSLFGNGSSLAIAGAHALSAALAEGTGDLGTALARYEQQHRRLTDPRSQQMSLGASLLVPRSQAAIAVRNLALHLCPVAAAGARMWSMLRGTGQAASTGA